MTVRVAVVDSGVDTTHAAFASARITTFTVEPKGPVLGVVPGASGDGSGHGTACAGIIHKLVPEADLVSVRALGPDGRGSREALVAALRFCVREGIHVVNLSLGIDLPKASPVRPTDARSILDLYEVADDAFAQGIVLVAAGPNTSTFRTYPGKAKSLIGVGRGSFADPERLESSITGDYELVAAGVDVVAPAVGGGERKWTGTSFACPHVAAHAARVVARLGTKSALEVRAELHAIARRYVSEKEQRREAS
ncbi:MAG: S8 family serine peptidase [Polyangiaceae bacterium]|nr:S8 family serine peptidase [Polyangiaceae bacterium]